MELKKTTLEFDTKKLMQDIRAVADGESLRDLESVSGVSASTLSRVDNGTTPDMSIFMRLCESFKLQPGDYFIWVDWSGKVRD